MRSPLRGAHKTKKRKRKLDKEAFQTKKRAFGPRLSAQYMPKRVSFPGSAIYAQRALAVSRFALAPKGQGYARPTTPSGPLRAPPAFSHYVPRRGKETTKKRIRQRSPKGRSRFALSRCPKGAPLVLLPRRGPGFLSQYIPSGLKGPFGATTTKKLCFLPSGDVAHTAPLGAGETNLPRFICPKGTPGGIIKTKN